MVQTLSSTCAIAIMAKTPQAGRSKTRLCPPLTYEDAAKLSAAFLRDTSDNLAMSAKHAAIIPYAAYAPAGSEEALHHHLAPGTRLILADGTPQMPSDINGFGRCLLHAIQGMLAEGHEAACVLSSDGPTLPTQLLIETAAALLGQDDKAVLGPAADGGYYLLGLKKAHAHMFADIDWSTERVADQTRARARELGLPLYELATWNDADDAASLSMLLDDRSGYPAPHTRKLADQMQLSSLLKIGVVV